MNRVALKRIKLFPAISRNAVVPVLVVVSTLAFGCVAMLVSPGKTPYRLDGNVELSWPWRLYEGSSGVVDVTFVPSGAEYDPTLERAPGQTLPFDETTWLRRPRFRAELSSDATIDISEPRRQEKVYDSGTRVKFSWSVYAREMGDHTLDCRVFIETAKDKFREMSISPVRMKMTVTKLDAISRQMWIFGTMLAGVGGFFLLLRQLLERKKREQEA